MNRYHIYDCIMLQDMANKKVLEVQQREAEESEESIQLPLTAEKMEAADDTSDKGLTRSMLSPY